MKETSIFKLASTLIALAFLSASGAAIASSSTVSSNVTLEALAYAQGGTSAAQDGGKPADCLKNPDDPRCKDKK